MIEGVGVVSQLGVCLIREALGGPRCGCRAYGGERGPGGGRGETMLGRDGGIALRACWTRRGEVGCRVLGLTGGDSNREVVERKASKLRAGGRWNCRLLLGGC